MANDVSVRAVGDIMTGFSYAWRHLTEPPEQFAAHHLRRADAGLLDPSIRSALLDADVTIGNLEAVISPSFEFSDSETPPPLVSPPETAQFLADSGFDAVHIHNNHILDYGEAAVEETKRRLAEVGVEHVGSPLGRERPTTLSRNGTDVHVAGFNLCDVGRPNDRDELLDAANELAAREGISILSLHWGWGYEHALQPSPDQVSLARELASTGVDVLLGHHSHTFQPVDVQDGTVIAYSLGNFIFDMWRRENVESGVLELELSSEDRGPTDVDVTTTVNDSARVTPRDVPRIAATVPTTVDPPSRRTYEKMAEEAKKTHRNSVLAAYARNSLRVPLRYHARTMKWWASRVLGELRSSSSLRLTG